MHAHYYYYTSVYSITYSTIQYVDFLYSIDPTLGCISSGSILDFFIFVHNVSGRIICAHQEIVEFQYPPGAASNQLQTPCRYIL